MNRLSEDSGQLGKKLIQGTVPSNHLWTDGKVRRFYYKHYISTSLGFQTEIALLARLEQKVICVQVYRWTNR